MILVQKNTIIPQTSSLKFFPLVLSLWTVPKLWNVWGTCVHTLGPARLLNHQQMCGFYIFSVLIPVFVGATWVPRAVKDSDSFPLVATKVSQYSQNHNPQVFSVGVKFMDSAQIVECLRYMCTYFGTSQALKSPTDVRVLYFFCPYSCFCWRHMSSKSCERQRFFPISCYKSITI